MSDAIKDSPVWGIAEIDAYFASHFPHVARGESLYETELVTPRHSRLRLKHSERNLRPGGTIQGPAMMALADMGAYVTLMGAYGADAADAVTTSLQIDFLRKPAPGDILAHTELVKAGRRLAVCHVRISNAEDGELLAVSSCTYALPRTIDS